MGSNTIPNNQNQSVLQFITKRNKGIVKVKSQTNSKKIQGRDENMSLIHFPKIKEDKNQYTDSRIKGLMTTENVKNLFDISTTTLYRWSSQDNILPKYKVGRRIYFKGEDIERLIK